MRRRRCRDARRVPIARCTIPWHPRSGRRLAEPRIAVKGKTKATELRSCRLPQSRSSNEQRRGQIAPNRVSADASYGHGTHPHCRNPYRSRIDSWIVERGAAGTCVRFERHTIPLKVPAHHLLNLTAAHRRAIPEGPHSAAQPGAGNGGTQAEMIFNGTTGGSKIIGQLRVSPTRIREQRNPGS